MSVGDVGIDEGSCDEEGGGHGKGRCSQDLPEEEGEESNRTRVGQRSQPGGVRGGWVSEVNWSWRREGRPGEQGSEGDT